MNQIFRFKSFPAPGWLNLLLLFLVIAYFNFSPKLFGYFGLGQVENKIVAGIIFLLPLYVFYYIISHLILAYLKSGSSLEIKDGVLSFIMLSKVKWSVPVSAITFIDATEGQSSLRADLLKTLLSRRMRSAVIGFSFAALNKVYVVKPLLQDYEGFKQALVSLNPAIRFDAVTAKFDQSLSGEDLGKVLQQKANGLPVLSDLGKLISKLNLFSALFIGLLITFALIIWLAVSAK